MTVAMAASILSFAAVPAQAAKPSSGPTVSTYELNPPAVPDQIRAALESGVAPMASGGGCATTYATRSCISFIGGYTWNLRADYYQDNLSGIPAGATAAVWTFVPGASPEWRIHSRHALTVGYHGAWLRGLSQGGYGWTVVEVNHPGGWVIYDAWSPIVNFP
jgi:hypothetical protein